MDASIDVIALLEIDVLEKISADGSRGNGIPIHLDASQMWNSPFDRHEPFAQIFIDRGLTIVYGPRGVIANRFLDFAFLLRLRRHVTIYLKASPVISISEDYATT